MTAVMHDPALQPIVCLLGYPAAGSPMQLAMERAFVAAKIDWRYLTLDVSPERLASAMSGLQSLGFRGAHLTGSLRQQAIEFMDQLDETARLAQWVDSLSVAAEGLIGHNRWGSTIRNLLGEPEADGSILFYGDDPSVLAIGFELVSAGWKTIHFDGMKRELGAAYGERLQVSPSTGQKVWSSGTRAVIVGEAADTRSIIEKAKLERLKRGSIVVDLSHLSSFSSLTRSAEQLQLTTVSGLEAMIRYTSETFAAWTGINPEEQLLRESFEEYYEI